VLVAALLSGCAETGAPAASPAAVTRTVFAADFDGMLLSSELVRLTNRERATHGVPMLVHRIELDRVADRQAGYMGLVERPDHFNPIPGANTVGERVALAHLYPLVAAENAAMVPAVPGEDGRERAYSYAALAETIIQGWMNSPGHRANILNPELTQIGCAALMGHGVGGSPRLFAAQVFTSDLEH
jgi:uncharacterized protein YkwD